ncbi:MAG: DUF222 domain-containing protein, partial [Actinomycetota bacterium]|nr:DUF222 domain-containing protein [Actinomycetota bacterium]
MWERLAEFRDALNRHAAIFDPALLSAEQAALAVTEAAAIERLAATMKGLAAARSAATGVWRAAGERSAAHHLARATGTSIGQTTDGLETAGRLEKLPETAAAARAGALSATQAAAVTDAALLDPRPRRAWWPWRS